MRSRTVSEAPDDSSKRQRSTASAFSLKRAKLTPLPSQVAPSGYGCPGDVRIFIGRCHCENRADTGREDSRALVAEPLVDHVHQRLAPLEPPQVLLEDLPDEIHGDA